MEVHQLPEGLGEDVHLWTIPTPNGHQIQIALEELKAEYGTRFSWTCFESTEQKKPWYLALNPNGKMPMILDKTQEHPISIMECGAIFIWFAEMHDKELKYFSLASHVRLRKSQMTQWLFWSASGVAAAFAQLYYSEHSFPERIALASDFHHKEVLRLLDVLDKHLAGVLSGDPERDYVAGDGKGKYSYADMALFPYIYKHEFYGILKEEVARLSHLKAWLDRVGSRPTVQRGINSYSMPV